MTDAGPLDLLVELRDRDGGRHEYADLLGRAVRYEVGAVTVLLAALDDIIESKQFAGREQQASRRSARTAGAPTLPGTNWRFSSAQNHRGG